MKTPSNLTLNQTKTILTVTFDDNAYPLSAQYLRVYSPSAEVRGHAPGEGVLQTDKEKVTIVNIEAVGNYAVKLTFSDGHDSGIYSWALLYDLSTHQKAYWQHYLKRLNEAGHSRQTD